METDNRRSNADFDEYRRNMHPQEEEGRSVVPAPKRPVALAFGIFMVLFYIAIGILLIINVFQWTTMPVMRYICGIALILYGVFRAYRYYVGSESSK